jgi:transposase
MSQKSSCAIAVIGIDIGKNSFHVVGHDHRGAIVLRQKWSRGQVEARLANLPPCLIGMEACVGAHHLSRKLKMLGHDPRLMPAKYVRPYSKGQKNDFRDAEAIAEAVQRPTMKFVRVDPACSATAPPAPACRPSRHRCRLRGPAAAPWGAAPLPELVLGDRAASARSRGFVS